MTGDLNVTCQTTYWLSLEIHSVKILSLKLTGNHLIRPRNTDFNQN